jgi:hypothetical protein
VDIKNSSGAVLVNVNSNGSVGIGTTSPSVTLDVLGKIVIGDGSVASQPSYNAGITTEATTSLIDLGVNEDSANRFGGSYNSSLQGGLFRVDTRAGEPLFQWLGRQAGSTSGATTLMTLSSAGYLGIGMGGSISQIPLDVETSAFLSYSNFEYYASNPPGHFSGSNNQFVSIKTAGTIWVGGEFDVTSDRRVKENIVKIDPQKALEFVKKSKPVFFKWKNQDRTNYGFIAQDLLKSGFDPLVVLVPDEKMKREVDKDGFVSPEGAKFSVNYEEIPALLTTALKNIYHRVLKLEHKNIDRQISSLEAGHAELKLKDAELTKESAQLKAYFCNEDPATPFCK